MVPQFYQTCYILSLSANALEGTLPLHLGQGKGRNKNAPLPKSSSQANVGAKAKAKADRNKKPNPNPKSKGRGKAKSKALRLPLLRPCVSLHGQREKINPSRTHKQAERAETFERSI